MDRRDFDIWREIGKLFRKWEKESPEPPHINLVYENNPFLEKPPKSKQELDSNTDSKKENE